MERLQKEGMELRKDILMNIINSKETSDFYSFIKGIQPLDNDIALMPEYLEEICIG